VHQQQSCISSAETAAVSGRSFLLLCAADSLCHTAAHMAHTAVLTHHLTRC
jgi:hypothetical protein